MVNVGFGIADGLIRARPRLREFIQERLLQNQPFSEAAATQATSIINRELRPFLENVVSPLLYFECYRILEFWVKQIFSDVRCRHFQVSCPSFFF